MEVMKIPAMKKSLLDHVLKTDCMNIFKYCMKNHIKKSLIVEGESLKFILLDEKLKRVFIKISQSCESVICCRVTPE